MQIAIQVLLVLVSVAYPFLWYFGRELGFFPVIAAGMCVLWLIRGFLQPVPEQKKVSWILSFFFAASLVWGHVGGMYWYPVLVSMLMLLVFGSSLQKGQQTVIERLARLQYPDLPPEGVRYTRRVTQIWCVFFMANATVAALLVVYQHYQWWAFYTGGIAYAVMGCLFAGEWGYRKWVMKL